MAPHVAQNTIDPPTLSRTRLNGVWPASFICRVFTDWRQEKKDRVLMERCIKSLSTESPALLSDYTTF